MITVEQLTEFFGWTALLNIGFLVVVTLLMVVLKSTIIYIHQRLFTISDDALPIIYFRFLATYKVLSLIFSVVPYIALKIMGG